MAEEESRKSMERENLPEEPQSKPDAADDRRLICQFVLIVALIFVVPAMEKGSYRTPWPVAILVSVLALALCAWLRARNKS